MTAVSGSIRSGKEDVPKDFGARTQSRGVGDTGLALAVWIGNAKKKDREARRERN